MKRRTLVAIFAIILAALELAILGSAAIPTLVALEIGTGVAMNLALAALCFGKWDA